MKKILAFAVAAVAMSSAAFAQTPGTGPTATADVDAQVVVPVVISKITDMDFGAFSRAAGAYIDAQSADAASFYVYGDEGDNVLFDFPASFTLTLDNPNGDPGVNPVGNPTTMNVPTNGYIRHTGPGVYTGGLDISFSPTLNNPWELSSGSTEHGATFDAANPGMGQMYLYIGGTVTPSNAQQRGTYSGTIPVTVSYVN